MEANGVSLYTKQTPSYSRHDGDTPFPTIRDGVVTRERIGFDNTDDPRANLRACEEKCNDMDECTHFVMQGAACYMKSSDLEDVLKPNGAITYVKK